MAAYKAILWRDGREYLIKVQTVTLPVCKICSWEHEEKDLHKGICSDCLNEIIIDNYSFDYGRKFITDTNTQYDFFVEYFFNDLEDRDKLVVVRSGISEKAYMECLKEYCTIDNDYDYIAWFKEKYMDIVDYWVGRFT